MSAQNGHQVADTPLGQHPDLPELEEEAGATTTQPAAGDWDVTDDELERWVRKTLVLGMTGEAKPAQVSAASCAVRFMAVKAKLPVVYGEGLDE